MRMLHLHISRYVLFSTIQNTPEMHGPASLAPKIKDRHSIITHDGIY